MKGTSDSAVYGTEVLAALNGQFLGYLVIADTIKEEAADAVAAIRSKGIITVMLTGDARGNADAVAKATGIDEVHARLLPQEKLDTLQKIRAEHGAVMFVGDGINDAPVLAGADVGAAMGSGADAAIEAADVVFMTSRLDAAPDRSLCSADRPPERGLRPGDQGAGHDPGPCRIRQYVDGSVCRHRSRDDLRIELHPRSLPEGLKSSGPATGYRFSTAFTDFINWNFRFFPFLLENGHTFNTFFPYTIGQIVD